MPPEHLLETPEMLALVPLLVTVTVRPLAASSYVPSLSFAPAGLFGFVSCESSLVSRQDQLTGLDHA
jgi:hypothetical protein